MRLTFVGRRRCGTAVPLSRPIRSANLWPVARAAFACFQAPLRCRPHGSSIPRQSHPRRPGVAARETKRPDNVLIRINLQDKNSQSDQCRRLVRLASDRVNRGEQHRPPGARTSRKNRAFNACGCPVGRAGRGHLAGPDRPRRGRPVPDALRTRTRSALWTGVFNPEPPTCAWASDDRVVRLDKVDPSACARSTAASRDPSRPD